MKKFILATVAMTSIVACKKNENTTVTEGTDTTAVIAITDSTKVNDSANVANNNIQSMNAQDKQFADDAAKGGLMEVMMGDLAQTNASDAKVKELGQMMKNDHSKANDELKSWASTIGYTLPTSLDADKQKKYDDLKAKTGADFDRAYTDLMVSDHKEDIEKFKKETAEGSEAALKAFASKTLPTLEHHLTMSQETKSVVK